MRSRSSSFSAPSDFPESQDGSTNIHCDFKKLNIKDTPNQCALHSSLDPFVDYSDKKKSFFNPTNAIHKQNSLSKKVFKIHEIVKRIKNTHVTWDGPRNLLLLTKPKDRNICVNAKGFVFWLLKNHSPNIKTLYLDPNLELSKLFAYEDLLRKLGSEAAEKIKFWGPDTKTDSLEHNIDLVFTLGGDGTVLYSSWAFQRVVPIIASFNKGSLGFMTPFKFKNYRRDVSKILLDGANVSLRMRFMCTVFRFKGDKRMLKRVSQNRIFQDFIQEEKDMNKSKSDICQNEYKLPPDLYEKGEEYHILNDLVVERGLESHMSLLNLYGDDEYITTVQADGLTVATPTGSTAYSLSAGGSLVHPHIPAILITPNCPHSLSFRPMLLPETTNIYISLPFSSRGNALASFDGRGRTELKRGDFISVKASHYPFPMISSNNNSSTDWFSSLNRCLNWNHRVLQKETNFSDTE